MTSYYRPGMRVIVQNGNDVRGMSPVPDPPWPEGTLIERSGRGWWVVELDDGRRLVRSGRHLFPVTARAVVQRWQDIANLHDVRVAAWNRERDAVIAAWNEAHPYPAWPAENAEAADAVFSTTPYGRRR